MTYITAPQSPRAHQLSIEELLGIKDPVHFKNDPTGTRTICVERVPGKLDKDPTPLRALEEIARFNEKYTEIREEERKALYYTFCIPKRSGKLRRIDAPYPELMNCLYELKGILDSAMPWSYHTSAYAYVRGRCAVDAVRKHQSAESRWILKLDLSNFFGSITLQFAMDMLSMIYPFSAICESKYGYEQLEMALELAFLNGGLPQGTPISPLITNIIMIPIDHALCNGLNDFNKTSFVYTRYADDIDISSKYSFRYTEVVRFVEQTFNKFKAPFKINHQKTHYGSTSGRNWMLGVMLNGNNEITIGRAKKKQFEAMLHQFATDYKSGNPWDKPDIQVLNGLISYYRSVEGNTIDRIIQHFEQKTGVAIAERIAQGLK